MIFLEALGCFGVIEFHILRLVHCHWMRGSQALLVAILSVECFETKWCYVMKLSSSILSKFMSDVWLFIKNPQAMWCVI